MESPQNIKKRLKSVNNIGQITKAMELVSATKMRKSQEIALASRPYAFAALDFLATISILENHKLPVLFEVRKEIKKVLFVLVTSDKGLAGAFNSSIFRKFEQHLKEERDEWKKRRAYLRRSWRKVFCLFNKKRI
jgi:F-type H+-transporting ATPase subunit gamma